MRKQMISVLLEDLRGATILTESDARLCRIAVEQMARSVLKSAKHKQQSPAEIAEAQTLAAQVGQRLAQLPVLFHDWTSGTCLPSASSALCSIPHTTVPRPHPCVALFPLVLLCCVASGGPARSGPFLDLSFSFFFIPLDFPPLLVRRSSFSLPAGLPPVLDMHPMVQWAPFPLFDFHLRTRQKSTGT